MPPALRLIKTRHLPQLGINPRVFALGCWGGTVQVLVAYALLVQVIAHDTQVVNKLAKHQGLVFVVEQLFQHLGEDRKFRRGCVGVFNTSWGLQQKRRSLVISASTCIGYFFAAAMLSTAC